MGFLSKIFGGEGAYKKSRRDLEKARDMEMSYYEKLAYEDPMQRSETQAALNQAHKILQENNKRTAATAAVTGASDASIALQKQGATDAIAGITRGISESASNKKDAAMAKYLGANREYTNAINNIRLTQAKNEADALSGLIQAGTSLATAGITGGAKNEQSK